MCCDVHRFNSLSSESQELYQRELVQHGKTMQELATVKTELDIKTREVLEVASKYESQTTEFETLNVSQYPY